MPQASKRAVRFVRALETAGIALRVAGNFRVEAAGRVASLPEADVAELASAGIIAGDGKTCRTTPEARGWLRRQLLADDPYAAQHRDDIQLGDGTRRNRAESPLARLATASAGETQPFLAPHQVEAGERLRRLVERARLRPRLTMSYDAARVGGRSGDAGRAADIGEMAADARRRLGVIIEALPRDCAGVVLDVCGLEKGLQVIEMERGWPRRSAKLVLRIGLDQLAAHFGLAPSVTGRHRRIDSAWMEGERLALFTDP